MPSPTNTHAGQTSNRLLKEFLTVNSKDDFLSNSKAPLYVYSQSGHSQSNVESAHFKARKADDESLDDLSLSKDPY